LITAGAEGRCRRAPTPAIIGGHPRSDRVARWRRQEERDPFPVSPDRVSRWKALPLRPAAIVEIAEGGGEEPNRLSIGQDGARCGSLSPATQVLPGLTGHPPRRPGDKDHKAPDTTQPPKGEEQPAGDRGDQHAEDRIRGGTEPKPALGPALT